MDLVDDIANRYVKEWTVADPSGATIVGIAADETALTDFSPAGFAARADLDRRTLAALTTVEPTDERQRVAKSAMSERLAVAVELYDSGSTTSEVNVIACPLQAIRETFDLMPTEGEQAASNIAARLRAVPSALEQWRATLLDAAARGDVAPRQRLVEVAAQCANWASPSGDHLFPRLASRVAANAPALAGELASAAAKATDATAAIGRFLREDLAARAPERQAAGRERYQLASRFFLGTRVDLDDAYAWGFEELARIEAEMRQVAGDIVPEHRGASDVIERAVAALDADPARVIATPDGFRDWMQRLADQAIAELHGTHFDIPEPVRRIECRIAPITDGGIYYTGPSEDFTRPGRMWWAVPVSGTTFSTWREVTTVYHEGVPGHHLQIGQAAARPDLLNRWQRLLSWCSGHGEGWALYAERLMDELGYLADPGDRLGMLDGQRLRAVRVVIDLGMHLELTIPRGNPFGFHPGERWTPELGWEFLRGHCQGSDGLLRFEINRYLGWPGQAPAYKLGERIWLRARQEAKARKGAAFDLAEFHRDALNLGSLGLDPFLDALSRT